MEKEWYSISELASKYGKTKEAIRKRIMNDKFNIKSEKHGTSVMVNKTELYKFN